jgi:quinol monooxygenase YgiN
MNPTVLIIVAKILAREEKLETVKSDLLKLVLETKEKEGCLVCDLHQDNTNANLFLVYEKWESKAHLQNHINSEHFLAFKQSTEGAIEEFTVNEITKII